MENLTIDDSGITNSAYSEPTVFGDFRRDATASDLLPYSPTEEVILKNIRVVSGKQLKLSPNSGLFMNTRMTTKGKN